MPMHLPSSLRSCDLAHDIDLICYIPQHTQNPAVALNKMIRLVLQALHASPFLYKFRCFSQIVTWYPGKQLRTKLARARRQISSQAYVMRNLHVQPSVDPFHVLWASDVHGRPQLPCRERLVYTQVLCRLSEVRQSDLYVQWARDHEAEHEEAQSGAKVRDAAQYAKPKPQPEEGDPRKLQVAVEARFSLEQQELIAVGEEIEAGQRHHYVV